MVRICPKCGNHTFDHRGGFLFECVRMDCGHKEIRLTKDRRGWICTNHTCRTLNWNFLFNFCHINTIYIDKCKKCNTFHRIELTEDCKFITNKLKDEE